MKNTVWIVGGSTGIGFEICKRYLQDDTNVVVSSRSASTSEALQKLKLQYGNALSLIDMDVSNTESTLQATQKAWDAYGSITLCLYNAGVYESMHVENWNMKHFEQMTQINYLGALRVTNALIPFYMDAGRGRFVYNISVSSYFGLPYGGGYSAPKAALLNFCESIEPELERKNIRVQVINHGFVKTRLTAKNDFTMPQLLEPKEAAKIIVDSLEESRSFQIKFPFMITAFLHFLRVIPYKMAFYFTKKAL